MSDANSSPDATPANQDDTAAATAGVAGAGAGALLEMSMIASNALTRREVEDLRQLVEHTSTLASGLVPFRTEMETGMSALRDEKATLSSDLISVRAKVSRLETMLAESRSQREQAEARSVETVGRLVDLV